MGMHASAITTFWNSNASLSPSPHMSDKLSSIAVVVFNDPWDSTLNETCKPQVIQEIQGNNSVSMPLSTFVIFDPMSLPISSIPTMVTFCAPSAALSAYDNTSPQLTKVDTLMFQCESRRLGDV